MYSKITDVRTANLKKYTFVTPVWINGPMKSREWPRMAENVKLTIYKPDKMKTGTYDRLMKKLVAILEKLEVGVEVKNVR